MIPENTSRFRPTKSKHYQQYFKNLLLIFRVKQVINLIGGPLLLFYYFLSMSMFYQVMGAIRCPKIKKHAGVRLLPPNKAKESFAPNDIVIYKCETTGFSQSIKCLDSGQWNEIPTCPDPTNNTCPELGPLLHGSYNSSGPPYRVGTVVAFRCDNEVISNSTTLSAATAAPATSTTADLSFQLQQNISMNSDSQVPRFNLTGAREIRCLASSKWNQPMPMCTPFVPEPTSSVNLVLTSAIIILIPILIIVTMFHLFVRWRKRQQQRERWKQYFTDYKYRHSKTSITFGMRPSPTTVPSNPIPVTDL